MITKKIENVFKNDQSIYRTLSPEFEINLCDGETCHVAEIIIKTDKPKPGEIRVSISNDKTNWMPVAKFTGTGEEVLKYIVPGEQYGKYLKLFFPKNINGSKFVAIKYIIVRGIKKALIK